MAIRFLFALNVDITEESPSDLMELKEMEKSIDLTRADSVSSIVSRIDSLKQSKLSLANEDKAAVMKQVEVLNEKKKLIESEKSETGRVIYLLTEDNCNFR